MIEVGLATSRRTRTGASYASQWNRFVAWSQASGKRSLPASPDDVASYLEDRLETGADLVSADSHFGHIDQVVWVSATWD